MNSPDPFNLARFVTAQADTFAPALAELQRGGKDTHWMWFIFPQLVGLGTSPTARLYAITSRAEAEAYLQHPVLGPRLTQCAEALLQHTGKSATTIMGPVDAMKLQSSATLFAACSAPGSIFHRVLDHYFAGTPDPKTLTLLTPPAPPPVP